MLLVNKSHSAIWTGLLIVLLMVSIVYGQTPNTLDRPYNYIILYGSDIPDWLGLWQPTMNLRFYKYSLATDTWSPIPFQFDNKQDNLFDSLDEMAFMTFDMGDQAPSDAWVDDAESKLQDRFEVHASDPLNPGQEGWIYIYRSSTLPLSGTKYIQHEFDNPSNTDMVESPTYEIDHGDHGFQQHLKLKTAAGGDYTDFLDRQKFRLGLHVKGFGLDAQLLFKEEMNETVDIETGVSAEIEVRKQGVNVKGDGTVRLQRNLTLFGKVKLKVGGVEIYSIEGDFIFELVPLIEEMTHAFGDNGIQPLCNTVPEIDSRHRVAYNKGNSQFFYNRRGPFPARPASEVRTRHDDVTSL